MGILENMIKLGILHPALFHPNEKYQRLKYLIMLTSNISDVNFHKYTKIKINSDGNLPLEKILTLRHVVILVRSNIY